MCYFINFISRRETFQVIEYITLRTQYEPFCCQIVILNISKRRFHFRPISLHIFHLDKTNRETMIDMRDAVHRSGIKQLPTWKVIIFSVFYYCSCYFMCLMRRCDTLESVLFIFEKIVKLCRFLKEQLYKARNLCSKILYVKGI